MSAEELAEFILKSAHPVVFGEARPDEDAHAGAGAQQHHDRLRVAVAGDEVELAVTIEIAERSAYRPRTREPERTGEMKRSLSKP